MRLSNLQIERIAREFWSKTAEVYRHNFDIISAVNTSLSIDLIAIEALSLQKIERWLNSRTIAIDIDVDDRNLHGALLIKDGAVFMFVEDAESEIEQQFTIAHEVSHFLLDYQIPREKAILEFGADIEEVLNGNMEANRSQLLKSLIKGIHINPYTFLLEKTGTGSFENWNNFNSENEADYLALELLAPRVRVINETAASIKRLTYSQFIKKSHEILTEKYRLPATIAEQYASELAYSVTNGPSFLDKLGL